MDEGHYFRILAIGMNLVLHDSVGAALASGVRLIDTAYMYGNEAEVGRAVREACSNRE